MSKINRRKTENKETGECEIPPLIASKKEREKDGRELSSTSKVLGVQSREGKVGVEGGGGEEGSRGVVEGSERDVFAEVKVVAPV